MLNKTIIEDIDFIAGQPLPWHKLEGATVLIAGATGYLPVYMVETLLYLNDRHKKNIKVIALARNPEKVAQKFGHHLDRKDLEFIYQDVCDPIKLKLGQKVDYVIHAASQASPKYYEADPVGTLSANTVGTINLLSLAKKDVLKGFLYLSTGGVYGRVEDWQIPVKEDDYGYLDPTDVKTCYSESKRMGENICVSWFHQYGIPTRIVRISYVYGPGMDQNDGRVFPAFVSDVVNGRDIVLKSDGSATRSFCYIADATLAFFTVLLKGADGQAYNVGVEKETSILELANSLVKLFPEKKLKVIIQPESRAAIRSKGEVRRSCLDISKIRSLGWQPQHVFEQSCRKTILSYEATRQQERQGAAGVALRVSRPQQRLQRVLITGGSGFIARNMLEQEPAVHQLTARGSKELNLLDHEGVERYFKNNAFDVIIHTATYDAASKYSVKDPARVLENNLKMFFNLARCRNHFGKMFFFGSGAEYDRQHWRPRMKEDYFDQYVPGDQYGLSKYIMTKHAQEADNIYNLRLFAVFGKYEDWRIRVISNLCHRAVMGEPLEIDQNKAYDFLYVDDLLRLMNWFIANQPKHKVYNICSGRTMEFKAIARTIRDISGKDLQVSFKEPGLGVEYSGDNSLLLNELGGFDFARIEDSIRDLYHWYERRARENVS